jgi:hypothetical protein
MHEGTASTGNYRYGRKIPASNCRYGKKIPAINYRYDREIPANNYRYGWKIPASKLCVSFTVFFKASLKLFYSHYVEII